MNIIFKEDLMKKIKSPVTWGLIIVILFMSYIGVKSETDKRKMGAYAYGERSLYETSGEVLFGEFDEETKESWDRRTHDILIEVHNRLVKYYKKDSPNFSKASAFSSIISANLMVGPNNPNPFLNKMLKEKSLEIWDEVSDGINYEDVNFTRTGAKYPLEQLLIHTLHAKVQYYFYKNNINLFIDTYSNIEFTYRFLITVLPILIIIVGIIINYNNINKEVKEGSAKLVLTQSIQRWKYYLGKYFSGVITVLFIILVPMIIVNIAMGIKDGFQSLNYPILYDKQGLTRFFPSFNYIEKANELFGERLAGISNVPRMPISKETFVTQRNINIIPYYQYILLTLGFIILFVLFLVAFVQLFSSLINNQILSIAVSIGLYGGMYLWGQRYLVERNYNVNPFTMNNSARIVAGTQNATMLTVAIVLILSTIILLAIGLRYFKKKSI